MSQLMDGDKCPPLVNHVQRILEHIGSATLQRSAAAVTASPVFFDKFPTEIQSLIVYNSIESLEHSEIVLKMVCKAWYALLDVNESFYQRHPYNR